MSDKRISFTVMRSIPDSVHERRTGTPFLNLARL